MDVHSGKVQGGEGRRVNEVRPTLFPRTAPAYKTSENDLANKPGLLISSGLVTLIHTVSSLSVFMFICFIQRHPILQSNRSIYVSNLSK